MNEKETRRWVEIRLRTDPRAAPAATSRLFDMGSSGVITGGVESAYVEDCDPVPEEDPAAPRTLVGYFSEGEGGGAAEELLLYGKALREIWGEELLWEVESRVLGDEDWAEGWRSWFRPTRITGRITVCPVSEPYEPAPGERIVRMDPGLAFGTGLHVTTRQALELIEEVKTERMLDVGCGAGLLSISSLLLGARSATAVDTDSEAVRVARENARTNGLAHRIEILRGSTEVARGTFGLVAANILAEVLVRLAKDLKTLTAPGGVLVLSGVLADREGMVAGAFEGPGLAISRRIEEEGWVALAYRKELS